MSWRARVGDLSAGLVVLGFYVGLLVATVVLSGSAQSALAIALIVLLMGYCLARYTGGWTILSIAAAPASASAILEELGAAGWIGLLITPLAILLAFDEDRDSDEAETASSEASTP